MTLFELVAVGLLARGPFSKKNQGCTKNGREPTVVILKVLLFL